MAQIELFVLPSELTAVLSNFAKEHGLMILVFRGRSDIGVYCSPDELFTIRKIRAMFLVPGDNRKSNIVTFDSIFQQILQILSSERKK